MLTSCKVCIQLQWASLMHSVASAPGFNVVTSPMEIRLFGFSQLHQRSQSITTLHGYPFTTAPNQKIKGDSQFVQICGFKKIKLLDRLVRRKLEKLLFGKLPYKTWKNIGVCCSIQMDVVTSHDT